jgi:hypothetical protein
MRLCLSLCVFFWAPAVLACDTAVCLVDPDRLDLTRIITFEDTRSSQGPGHPVDGLLVLDGAVFGERFAGQSVAPEGDFDQITGTALSPLTVMPGDKGRNLSVVYLQGNNILNGYGIAGYPKRHAQGEGAIAFLFEHDQSSLSFAVRGGESGQLRVVFHARSGAVIAVLDLPPAGEHAFGFRRASGDTDIAGVLVTNTDPQGVALDDLRFGRPPDLG